MLDQIRKIIRGQPVVDRHQNRADLRDRVKRFELSVRVGRDVSDTITLSHTECLQGGRPTITSVEKLFVVQSQIAVHYSIAFGVELARATREFERSERRFHKRKSDDPLTSKSSAAAHQSARPARHGEWKLIEYSS